MPEISERRELLPYLAEEATAFGRDDQVERSDVDLAQRDRKRALRRQMPYRDNRREERQRTRRHDPARAAAIDRTSLVDVDEARIICSPRSPRGECEAWFPQRE